MRGDHKTYDIIIVGAGPAGLSAAIWAADLGLGSIVIETGAEAGGNLLNIHNPITNYPGVLAANGREMRDIFRRHAEASNVSLGLAARVVKIGVDGSVNLADGSELRGRSILLATGVRRRKLGIDGEDSYIGRGILDSGARQPSAVQGMNVAVIGGGDAAAENAAILAPYAQRVYLIHRGEKLSARDELADKALAMQNVVYINNRTVKALHGRDLLQSIEVVDGSGRMESLVVECVIFRIGVVPNSELLAGVVDLDPKGYVVTDSYGRTSTDGIFAAGDVACPDSPTIVTAAGRAAAAVKTIRAWLK